MGRRDQIPDHPGVTVVRRTQRADGLWIARTQHVKNIVTATGRNVLRDLIGNAGSSPIYMALGSDDTTPVDGDTALGAEVFRNAVTRIFLQPSIVIYQLRLLATQAVSFTIAELGLFTGLPVPYLTTTAAYAIGAGSGVLFARAVLLETIYNKSGSEVIDFTWTLQLVS